MGDFLMEWGAAIGIFIITGTLMQALNATIGGRAGDHGFKGFYFVWKRFFLLVLGAGLGALAPLVGLSSPIGDGYGYGIIDGIVAAFVAGQMYSLIVGSLKARVRHQLAKKGKE